MVAAYCVCVALAEGEESANSRWNVNRKLPEFQTLHRKLTEVGGRAAGELQRGGPWPDVSAHRAAFSPPQCFPSLKKLQLPSLSKLPFKSIDQKFLDKSKVQLNAFLQVRPPEGGGL